MPNQATARRESDLRRAGNHRRHVDTIVLSLNLLYYLSCDGHRCGLLCRPLPKTLQSNGYGHGWQGARDWCRRSHERADEDHHAKALRRKVRCGGVIAIRDDRVVSMLRDVFGAIR